MCTPSISDSKVALPIVTVHVRGTGHSGSVKALALLDTGSNKTFCSKELIEELGLKGSKNTLSIETLTNEVNDIDVSEVSLEVTSTSGKLANRTVVELPKVYVLPRFPVLKISVANPEDVIQWDHLRDIKVPQLRHMPETQVSILIGQDVPQALIPHAVRNGRNGEPYATRTVLGWTLNGPMGNESEGSCGVCNFVHADADVSLERQVENFGELDTDNCVSSMLPSVDDQKDVKLWSETTTICDGHFKEKYVLSDSRSMAEKRLSPLEKKLSNNPDLHARYKTGINDVIKNDFAETVSDEELDSSPGRTWYLPHHSVTSPADDISRGIHANELIDRLKWRNDPDFLWNSECEWPKSSEKCDDLLADDKEVKVKCVVHVVDASGASDASIRYDNGTNFVGGERELNVEFNAKCDIDKLKKHCLLNGIEWKFNPPAASHIGGSWERQIRSVRKVLNVVLRHENLDDERLETLFCVIESTVNSRPLNVSSSSVHDLEPLTPNHLLLLRPNSVRVEGKFVPQDVYTRRWRHVQLLADIFWKRWLREYIPTIQCRPKWFEVQPNVKIGDVVLVANEITHRNDWPLGRILEVFPDKDGLVRVMKVKTNAAILMRPVSKLVVLVSEIDNN